MPYSLALITASGISLCMSLSHRHACSYSSLCTVIRRHCDPFLVIGLGTEWVIHLPPTSEVSSLNPERAIIWKNW